MDDATMSFPEIPPDPGKGSPPTQDLADVSTVDYGLIYQTEKPALMRYLLHCEANYQIAEDVAQYALEELYRKWSTVTNPRAWLRKVATRTLARSRVSNECSLEGHDGVGIVPDVAELVEYTFENNAIFVALRQLPPREQQVFALHFDRFETSEIAEILQMRPAAVRQNLARARSRLKQLLGLKGAM